MKKQYKLTKALFIFVIILSVFQTIMLCIEPDLKHIILSCVVYAGTLLVGLFYLICYFEIKKIIFETEDNFKIRLVEEDDYQLVRQLLDPSELQNSPEEVEKLEEYKKITIDYIRLHYHYIVFDDNDVLGIFYARKEKDTFYIEFINSFDNEKVKQILISLAEKNNCKIIFK